MFVAQWRQNVREHDMLLYIANKREDAAREEGASSVAETLPLDGGKEGKEEGNVICQLHLFSCLPSDTFMICPSLLSRFPPSSQSEDSGSSESSPDAHIQGLERIDNGRIFFFSFFVFLKRVSASLNPLPPLGVIQ